MTNGNTRSCGCGRYIHYDKNPLYSERANCGYVQIKVVDPKTKRYKWVNKNRWVWEQKNGKIPHGNVILFLDRCKDNYAIDNLLCVDKRVQAILNKIDAPPEILKVAAAIAELQLKIKDRENDGK